MCGQGCLKCLLIIINIIFIIVGIVVVVIASLALAYLKKENYEMGRTVLIITITIGAFILVTGIIGCTGTLQKSTLLLIIYIAAVSILTIFSIAQIALASLLYKNADKIDDTLQTSIVKYNTDESTKSVWDSMQSSDECCGVNGFGDWKNMNMDLPESCCSNKDRGQDAKQDPKCKELGYTSVYDKGCKETSSYWIRKQGTYNLLIGIIILVIELVAIGLAIWYMIVSKDE